MDRTNLSSCGRRLGHMLVAALLIGLLTLPGCSSARLFSRRDKPNDPLEKNPTQTVAGIQGPTERLLNHSRWQQQRADLAKNGDAETMAALAAYDAAQELFDQEQYAEAEKQFTSLAKKRREKYESWGVKFNRFWGIDDKNSRDLYSQFGDAIEEDALFMAGQSQFAQQRYAAAQDSYEELLKHYPSTRHLDQVTRQMFRIARYWLGFPESIGESGDAGVQVALAEEEAGPPSMPSRDLSALDRVPVLPNLTDKTRPLFDTAGRGEQALRSIWLHDATGPLADDALMMAANYNLRTSNFVEAARLYALLREQYPDSPHLRDAYLLGSHVSLASYQGAAYDGQSLRDSKSLKETMLQIFPDMTAEQREQLQQEIKILQEAEVGRLWDLVEFYQVKGVDSAIQLHCYLILNRYPDSKYAEMARQALQQVEKRKERRENSVWSRFRRDGTSTPAKEIGPPGNVQLPDATAAPGDAEKSAPASSRRLPRLLRRAEQPPQLQPIDENSSFPADATGRASM